MDSGWPTLLGKHPKVPGRCCGAAKEDTMTARVLAANGFAPAPRKNARTRSHVGRTEKKGSMERGPWAGHETAFSTFSELCGPFCAYLTGFPSLTRWMTTLQRVFWKTFTTSWIYTGWRNRLLESIFLGGRPFTVKKNTLPSWNLFETIEAP